MTAMVTNKIALHTATRAMPSTARGGLETAQTIYSLIRKGLKDHINFVSLLYVQTIIYLSPKSGAHTSLCGGSSYVCVSTLHYNSA